MASFLETIGCWLARYLTKPREGGVHPYPTQAEAIKKLADAYNRTRLTPFIKKALTAWLKWQRHNRAS